MLDYRNKIYNVRELGAVGNGLKDDTLAFQRAFDAAKLYAGLVYIPAGNYKIDGVIKIYGNVKIQGDGWETKLLKTNAFNLFELDANAQNVTIRDIFFEGTGSGCAIYGRALQTGYGLGRIYIENVKIENFERGIDFEGNPINWVLDRLWVKQCGKFGVKLPTDSSLSNSFIGECGLTQAIDAKNANVVIEGWDVRVFNNHIWGGLRGITVYWAKDCRIQGNVIEENRREGIYLYGKASGHIISGNYLENNSLEIVGGFSAIYFDITDNYTCVENLIGLNRFGKEDNTQANHKYCVEFRDSALVIYRDNLLIGNQVANGYRLGEVSGPAGSYKNIPKDISYVYEAFLSQGQTEVNIGEAFSAGSTKVFINGQMIKRGAEWSYTEDPALGKLYLNFAVEAGDWIVVIYSKA